jgi:ATP-binding cassette subfamily C protein
MSDARLELLSRLESQGSEEVVSGNTPFLLDGSENVWLIRSGKVEVFSLSVKDAEVTGPRVHFLTAEPGDVLFGIDLDAYGKGLGFLAVGVVGTRLLKLKVSQLREVAGSVGSDGLAAMVDRWITGLSAGASKTIVPKPRADLLIESEGEGDLGDGERVRAQKGVVWVRHLQGTSLFIGMEEVGAGDADALFPVTTDSFLQAMGDVRLSTVGTEEALRGRDGWAGLDCFIAALFSCEVFNVGLARADELNRLKEKAKRDRSIVSNALVSLASALERGLRRTSIDVEDPLLAAVKLIGNRLGFTVKPPQKRKDGTEHPDPLSEIVRASRIRARKVILKGEWWKEETTPLLAFIEDEHRPVAIWGRGPGKFELHDPAEGTAIEVTAEIASTLEPMAHTFYRPFPEGKLSAWRLFRFGLKDNQRDMVRPLIIALVVGLLGLLPPYFTGVLVQTVIPEASRSRLVELAVVLGVIGVTMTLLGVVRGLSLLRFEIKMSGNVQPAMWDRLLGLPVSFFRRYVAGDLSLRVSAVDQIRQVISGATMTTLMLSLSALLYVGQLIYYSWKLAVLGLAMALVLLAVAVLCTYLKLGVQRELMQIQGKISGLVLQLVTGISKLRVAAAEGRAFAEWGRNFGEQARLLLRAGTVDASLAIFNAGFPVLSSMALFYAMVYLSRKAIEASAIPMQIGDFVAFNTAFGLLLTQMLELAMAGLSILIVIPLFERARPILETAMEVDDTKADVGELNGQIEASHVSFRYQEDGPLILDDVSIEVPTGKFIALVGPSGLDFPEHRRRPNSHDR